ncbi:hypothetical protein ACFO4N_17110 [Camelliibacillus cellulosilyticus]|uniref:DUF5082 domain-containing protein n=1 Tax=Camelliibacillus cellulosilyticus TaxID=2174486 RepID=A0ABV9GR06_9BACL
MTFHPMDWIEKELLQVKYRLQAEALEELARNVKEAMDDFHRAVYLYKHNCDIYLSGWGGKAYGTFLTIGEQLQMESRRAYYISDQLIDELHRQASRLREKADGLD